MICMLAENFVTWLIGFDSLLVTGTRFMQAVVKSSRTQGGFAFTEISCGIWIVKRFLHMCVFTVSEPPIIRGQEFALRGRCGVQGCHLHSLQRRCSLCRLHSPAIRGTRPRRVPQGARDRPPDGAEHLFGSRTDSRDFLLRERLDRSGRQGTTQRTSG